MQWRTDDGGAMPVDGGSRRRRPVPIVIVLVLVIAFLVVLVGGGWWLVSRSGGPTDGGSAAPDGSVLPSTTATRTGGAADARADATVIACAGQGPTVEVTNSSEVPMRYLVAVEVTDPEGRAMGTVGARAEIVQAGATATLQADPGQPIPDGSTCSVAQVIKSPA